MIKEHSMNTNLIQESVQNLSHSLFHIVYFRRIIT